MAGQAKLSLRCPDCGSHLVVDAATGEVLFHKRPKGPPAGGRDFDDLIREMNEDRSQAEDIFQREVEAMKDRDRLLEERFEEAMKRAEEEPGDEPPPRPFDFD